MHVNAHASSYVITSMQNISFVAAPEDDALIFPTTALLATTYFHYGDLQKQFSEATESQTISAIKHSLPAFMELAPSRATPNAIVPPPEWW